MKMNRRSFLGSLFKAAIVAAIAPDVVTALKNFTTSKKILTLTHNGKEFWYDVEEYEAMKSWHDDLERKYFDFRYKNNFYIT
jgi:hypothetical protein